MSDTKAKNLSSLFLAAVKAKVATNNGIRGDSYNRTFAITSLVKGEVTRQPFVFIRNSSSFTATSTSGDEMNTNFAVDRNYSSEDHIPASNVKNLSSYFLTGDKTKIASNCGVRSCDRATLISSSSTSSSSVSDQYSHHPPESLPLIKNNSPIDNIDLTAVQNLKPVPENPAIQHTREISSILLSGEIPLKSYSPDSKSSFDNITEADIPWFSTITDEENYKCKLERQRELSLHRKREWNFRRIEGCDFSGLVKVCADRLGPDATIQVFNRLGRETGPKEYDALIELCIEKARSTDNADISAQLLSRTLELLKSVKECGFMLKDSTYGSILMYLTDMGMVEDFFVFSGIIKEDNPSSIVSLSYYEMLLWVKAKNKEKIQKLCSSIATDDGENKSNIMASYLLALCESDHKEEMVQLLKLINIAKVSLIDVVSNIFKYLGKQELGLFAERFILALNTSDYDSKTLSNLIFTYAVNLPNLSVEDVCQKFKNLYETMKVVPSSLSYELLIKYCCKVHKVYVALDIAEEMSEAGFILSIEMIDFMLHSCIHSQEFFLVHRIYAFIRRNDLQPNGLTFTHMIKLSLRINDLDGANNMLNNLQKMNLTPAAGIFNAVLSGYCRQNNFDGIMKVLKKMEIANVKPDTETFYNLIKNSECEGDIDKYFKELEASGVPITKNVCMSLIIAYGNCGQLEKARQVVELKGIPIANLNEIKCTLVNVLVLNGEISEALEVYKQIKNTRNFPDERNIMNMIIHIVAHTESDGNLSLLLELLSELTVVDYWVSSCFKILLYCVRYQFLSAAVDLFKHLKEKLHNDEVASEFIFDEVFYFIGESGSTHLQLGMDLIKAMKEELGMRPTRKCLDFLLTSCGIARDLPKALAIWREYHSAGLPYNVVSFLRMYQVLVASEDFESAKELRGYIWEEDPQVCCFLKQCVKTYSDERFLAHNRRTRREKRRDKRHQKAWNARRSPFVVPRL